MSKELFSKTAPSQRKNTFDYQAAPGKHPEMLVRRESVPQQDVVVQTREEKRAEIGDLRIRLLKYGYYMQNGVRHVHTKESWEAMQRKVKISGRILAIIVLGSIALVWSVLGYLSFRL